MESEKCGGKSGGPDIICCLIEKEEQEDNSSDMKKQTDQMMAGGVGSEQAPVQRMGEPGKRMPVTEIRCGKRPFNGLKTYSLLYLIIFGYISLIIKINKIIAGYPAEGG